MTKVKSHPRMEYRLMNKIKKESKITLLRLRKWLIRTYDYRYNPNSHDLRYWAVCRDDLELIEIDGKRGVVYENQ